MGPDCGTAIINGVPLGFANAVPRGRIGIAAASGTGLQEVACLIAAGGEGISHAIGVGGRDLSEAVGGLMMESALEALAADARPRWCASWASPRASCRASRRWLAETMCAPGRARHTGGRGPMGATSLPACRGVHVAATLEDAAQRGDRHRPRHRPSGRVRPPAGELRALADDCVARLGRPALRPGRVRRGHPGLGSRGPAVVPAGRRGARRSREVGEPPRGRPRPGRLHRGATAPHDRRGRAPRVDRTRGPRSGHGRALARYRPRPRSPSRPGRRDPARAARGPRARRGTSARISSVVASVCGTDADPQNRSAQVRRWRPAA